MKPSRSIFTLLTALLVSAGLVAVAQETKPAEDQAAPEAAPAESGEKGEAYEFPAVDEARKIGHDEALAIPEKHGAKLMVLNFWATWCGPCVKELPYFIAAQDKYRDQGVQFVGYNMDIPVYPDNWEQVAEKTMGRLNLNFPTLVLDVDPSVTFAHFGETWTGALPATFFYDAEGNLLLERPDALEKEELMADIEKLLADLSEGD